MSDIQKYVDRGAVTEHKTGTATTTAAAVPPTNKRAKELVFADVVNRSADEALLVSFDGGSNFNTVEPLANRPFSGHLQFPQVKVAANTAGYDIEMAFFQQEIGQ